MSDNGKPFVLWLTNGITLTKVICASTTAHIKYQQSNVCNVLAMLVFNHPVITVPLPGFTVLAWQAKKSVIPLFCLTINKPGSMTTQSLHNKNSLATPQQPASAPLSLLFLQSFLF